MSDTAPIAGAFYLGIEDDMTAKLRDIKREYMSFASDVLRINRKIEKTSKRAQEAMMATPASSAVAITSAMTGTGSPTRQEAARAKNAPVGGMLAAFRRVMGTFKGKEPLTRGLRPFATGGIVTKPTAGLVGEAGPEAVLPLKTFQKMLRDELSVSASSGANQSGMMTGAFDSFVDAFTKSREEVNDIASFFADSEKAGRSAREDAKKIAEVFASMNTAQFDNLYQQQAFIKNMTDSLMTGGAFKQIRKTMAASGRAMQNAAAASNQINKNVGLTQLSVQAILHGLEEGLGALNKLMHSTDSYAEYKRFAAQSNSSLGDVYSLDIESQKAMRAANMETVLFTDELHNARVAMREAGDSDIRSAGYLTRSILAGAFASATGQDQSKGAASLAFRLNNAGMDAGAQQRIIAGAALSRGGVRVDQIETFLTATADAVEPLKSMGMNVEGTVRSLMALQLATSNATGNQVDISARLNEMMSNPVEARRLSLLGNGPEAFLNNPALKAAMSSVAAGNMGAIPAAKASSLGLLDSLSDSDMVTLAKNYRKMEAEIENSSKRMLTGNTGQLVKYIDDNQGVLDKLSRKLNEFGSMTGLNQFLSTLQQYQVIDLAKGVFALGGAIIGLLQATVGLPLFALGLTRVGAAVPVAAGGIATGLTTIGGALAAFGAVITPVLIPLSIAAGLLAGVALAIGGAMWMIGEGLGAMAPLAGAIGSALVGTLAVLSGLNVTQMLALGPALAMIGGGFLSLAVGVVAGMTAMTAGDLMMKVGNFFGITSQNSVLDGFSNFVKVLSSLGPSISDIKRFAGTQIVLPMPTLGGDPEKAMAIIDTARKVYAAATLAAQDAAKVSQMSSGAKGLQIEVMPTYHVLDRLDKIISILQSIDSNRRGRSNILEGGSL